MKFRRIFGIVALSLSIAVCSFGQDIHFSQFENSSALLNPAFNSLFIGDWRAGLVYRNQWRSIDKPFQTYLGYIDKRWEWVDDVFTLGLHLNNDLSKHIVQSKAMLSLSYSRKLYDHSLTISFAPSFNQIRTRGDFSYPDQFDLNSFSFNTEVTTLEPLRQETENYFALNAGGLWSLSQEKLGAFAGIAISYLNSPSISFYDLNNIAFLPMKMTLHGGIAVQLHEVVAIQPSFKFNRQNKASELTIGSWMEIIFPKNEVLKGIRGGVYYRNNTNGYSENGFFNHSDAMTILFSLPISNTRTSISYDFNISGLQEVSNSRGAFELSLVYTAPPKKAPHYLEPCWMF